MYTVATLGRINHKYWYNQVNTFKRGEKKGKRKETEREKKGNRKEKEREKKGKRKETEREKKGKRKGTDRKKKGKRKVDPSFLRISINNLGLDISYLLHNCQKIRFSIN